MGKLAQWLPSITVQLARTVGLKYNQAAFRVAPSMTKFEIKKYVGLERGEEGEGERTKARKREGRGRGYMGLEREHPCLRPSAARYMLMSCSHTRALWVAATWSACTASAWCASTR